MCLLILAKSADAADPDRVLLLHSFGPDFSPWNTITPPFREALRKLAPNPIDLYEASLQAERFGVSPAREEGPFIDYLNALLPDRKPRLIVAMGAPVTRFVLRNRARLFPSSPLLIATSDVRTYEDLALTANDTACPTIYDPTIHIDHILRLLPDTDHIVVAMTGASATEQFWNDLFQRALQRSSRRVTLEWFTHLAADDMVKRVAALPAHSAIFYPTIAWTAAVYRRREMLSCFGSSRRTARRFSPIPTVFLVKALSAARCFPATRWLTPAQRSQCGSSMARLPAISR